MNARWLWRAGAGVWLGFGLSVHAENAITCNRTVLTNGQAIVTNIQTTITVGSETITNSVALTGREKRFGSEVVRFDVPGAGAMLVLPTRPAADGSRPWVWYAPRSPGDANGWAYERLLAAGFWVGCVDAGESMGNPASRRIFTDFYNVAVKEFKLSPKVCLMPQSRGGLMLYNWAAEHADSVQCVAGIYPVCDITACSWGVSFAAMSKIYGLSEEDMKAQLPQHNPIERLAPLAERKIPIFHITGDSDNAVPMERNTLELQRRYQALGGSMEVELVKGKGHQECPEIFQSQRFVDFLLSQRAPAPAK